MSEQDTQGRRNADEPQETQEKRKLVREARKEGDHLRAYDLASNYLDRFPDCTALRYEAVLALVNCGAVQTARGEYRRYFAFGGEMAGTVSSLTDSFLKKQVATLGARLEKEDALAVFARVPPEEIESRRLSIFAPAARRYQRIHRQYHEWELEYYAGINAATLWLLAGDDERARELAQGVLDACEHPKEEDQRYWIHATRAEANLILRRHEDAAAAMEAARKAARGDISKLQATRRQLGLIIDHLGEDRGQLDTLELPTVLHYRGHIFGIPEGSAAEAELRTNVESYLDKIGKVHAFGALAAGADIIIAESILAHGGDLHVVLPFQAADFIASSVRVAGECWVPRFHRCMAQATSSIRATEDGDMRDRLLYRYGSRLAGGKALLHARELGTDPDLVVAWDEKRAAREAGADTVVDEWKKIENTTFHRLKVTRTEQPPVKIPGGKPEVHRNLYCMLFGDLKGFSKLWETELHPFQQKVLGKLAQVIEAELGESKKFANTWGDAIYLVIDDAVKAASCALALQQAMEDFDWDAGGFRSPLQLRIGAHFGPAFCDIDPVMDKPNYFGTHVTRAARVEPITVPGQVFVTEAFAAHLALLGNTDFPCEYVGRKALAKGYASDFPMYLLRDSR